MTPPAGPGGPMRPPTPYDALVLLAEQELAAARAGEWEHAGDLAVERVERAARLPDAPPQHARPALERLAALQREIEERTRTARAEVARELAALARGRGAVRGYAPRDGAGAAYGAA